MGKVSRFLLFVALPCSITTLAPGEYALAQGELAYVQGELFVLSELWIGGLCSLLEHSFVSSVSCCCPCLRGPRLLFFKWSCSLPSFGFRSLVGVSFYLFLFFLLTVNFGTPSSKFTVNICSYLIFYPMVLTPRRYQVHSRMSILQFVVYTGN
jgi:hypothetical protein